LYLLYFPPQHNEIPSTEPDEPVGSMSQNKGRGFWNRHFSAYSSAAQRALYWMLHLCVLVYVISAVTFWKFQRKNFEKHIWKFKF
jgi:hypothetical protein